MQSLSLKVFTDFRVCKIINNNSSNAYGFPEFDMGSRKNCLFSPESRDYGLRVCKIVACSSQRNVGEGESPSSSPKPVPGGSDLGGLISRTQTYALLKQKMEVASKAEDYKEAARIRDSMRSFEEEEPVLRLKRCLKEAIVEERFEDAAKIRDELKKIAPYSLLKCASDAITLGIRVQVRSIYIEGRSQPSKGQYFYAYRIRITNNSDRPVQLLRRHWIITNANGKTENVKGTGVIGEQPVILPNTGFEYSSACPLITPNGRMEGNFEMKHVDEVGSKAFNVVVAPFLLSTLGDNSDFF